MRKTVQQTTDRIVHLCDLCEKVDSFDTCWLCRKDVCYKCRELLFCGKSEDWVDMPIKVCTTCIHGNSEIIAEFHSALNDVNRRLRVAVEAWKQAIKTERS